MKRIEWVDYCKTFAIFGVVFLHVHATPLSSKFINAFIMPLFFIISGFLFSYERNPSYKKFAIKRFHQLIIPYLWIGAVSYICWLLVLRKFGSNPGDDIIWYLPLAGFAGGLPTLLVFDVPLWSLLSFFIVEIIYYPLGKRVAPAVLCIVSFAVLTTAYFAIPEILQHIPLMLGPSIGGLFFYCLGYCTQKLIPKLTSVWLLPLSVTLFMVAAIHNNEVNFYICSYSNLILFIVSSVSGSISIIVIANLVSKTFTNGRLIKFISQSTLIICGFHLLVFAAAKGFALFCFGIEPDILTTGFWPGLTFALVCFALTLPICYLIRRYLHFLVNK